MNLLSAASFRIIKIKNIDIEINVTWLFVFLLVVFQLFTYFDSAYAQASSFVVVVLALITSGLFFGSLLAHELAHSLIANRNRMSIRKITLFIFGGVAQLEEEPSDPKVELKMAVAGPLCSLVLAGLLWILSMMMLFLGIAETVAAPFSYLAPINLALALFNLVPAFPLDGGRILRSILWLKTGDVVKATAIAARLGEAFAYFLIFAGLLLVFTLQAIEAVWFILIGWFLLNAAQASLKRSLFDISLANAKVKQIMTSPVTFVDAETTLEAVVGNYFLTHKYSRFPVSKGEAIIGVVTLADIRHLPRAQWAMTTVEEIVKPLSSEAMIDVEEPVLKAIDRMARSGSSYLLVTERERVKGIITRTDVFTALRIRSELGI